MERHSRAGKKSGSTIAAAKKASVKKRASKASLPLIDEAQGGLFLKLEKDPYFRTGYMYQMSGNLGAAAACYSRSIQSCPSPEAHTHMASVLAMMGELESAIVHARRAIEMHPEFGNAWNDLGTYLLEKHSYDEAIDCFQKAVVAKTCQTRSLAHYNLARAFICKGMLIAAENALNDCLKLDPHFDRALIMQSQVSRNVN